MRKIVSNVVVTGPIILEDLRWLIDQTSSYDANSKVEVKGPMYVDRANTQKDWDESEITVLGNSGG